MARSNDESMDAINTTTDDNIGVNTFSSLSSEISSQDPGVINSIQRNVPILRCVDLHLFHLRLLFQKILFAPVLVFAG